MKLQDLSIELFEELGEPTDISPSSIQFWLASNCGKLNALLNKNYELDNTSSELTEDLGLKESVILKKLYLIHDLDKKIRINLGAVGTQTTLQEVSSDGGVIRMVNRSELSKTYIQLRKEEMAELELLINSYNISESEMFGITGDENYSSVETHPFRIRVIQ